MNSLFVQLDVDYYHNDRVIQAGPEAELLYIRSLAWCKASVVDGTFTVRQIRAFAPWEHADRIDDLTDRLVAAGLWVRDGETIIITGWRQRNKPVADLRKLADARARAGNLGAHRQWHRLADHKKPKDCRYCAEEVQDSEWQTEILPSENPQVDDGKMANSMANRWQRYANS
ncbi:MAG: hypothetical protein M0Z91_12720 [Actinomycetota bacterium]|nr:hypothetical protein [Actinomycetota bacterium]